MKEATGELNLTVITIIMIGAILAFFWIMWDNIKKQTEDQWENSTDPTEQSYQYQDDNHSVAVCYEDTNYTMTW